MSAGISVRVMRALGLLAAMFALACLQPTFGAGQSAHWIQFQDPQTGLSSSGRAAVGWSVEVLEPRECTIVTLLGGADYEQSLPPPHNGGFPLLSIIRTVHFAPVNGTRSP